MKTFMIGNNYQLLLGRWNWEGWHGAGHVESI